MPVMIAHKADGAAADGVRLAVEHMNAGAVLHNHDFMEIMMMFWKRSLRKPWLDRDWRASRRKKIHAVQYCHNGHHR
jgi:hypothetical protein